MSNKKFAKLAVLSLMGVLSLTACSDADEIKSLPSNYDSPIITIDDETEKIHNNLVSIIADQFQEGDLPSKTLDKVLYRYAQTIYGAYNKITLPDGDTTSTTLKEAARIVSQKNAYDNDTGNPKTVEAPSEQEIETLYAFIRNFKVYWNYNDKGEHVDAQGVKVANDKTFIPCQAELDNVLSRFEDVEKRIAENMFAKAKNGSYTSKHFFKEYEFVKSLYEAGEDVEHYINVKADPSIKPLIIAYTVEDDEVFEKGILHRDIYQTNYGLDDDESEDVGTTPHQYHYIEKEILPEIYNDLLVEQYLLDEQSSAVKQSRARLINVIKIEKYSSFQINADLLVKQLVKEIYSRLPKGEYLSYIDEENNPYISIFEKYEDISKGLTVYDPTTVAIMEEKDIYDEQTGEIIPAKYEEYWSAKQIIARIHDSRSDAFNYKTYTTPLGETKEYYENTTFGDLVEDYEEYLSAESYDEIDTSLRDKFTSSGTITPEEGFDQEKISLSQTEAITKGWYVQKSAPTLDSNGEIKNRLFQLSVANYKLEAKDGTDAILKWNTLGGGLHETDRYETADGATWAVRAEKAPGENKYLCSINGAYFIKFEGSYAGSDYVNDIVYDDGSAYYICQVIEAVKDVKLRNSDSANSYAKTRAAGFLNKVISEVTTKVAETGSYSSLSKEYWLKKMNITYHDQKVYDYFKSNYPDLFDDEDK